MFCYKILLFKRDKPKPSVELVNLLLEQIRIAKIELVARFFVVGVAKIQPNAVDRFKLRRINVAEIKFDPIVLEYIGKNSDRFGNGSLGIICAEVLGLNNCRAQM